MLRTTPKTTCSRIEHAHLDAGTPPGSPESGPRDAGGADTGSTGTKTPDSSAPDASNPFKNLVQIDVRAFLTTNTIVTTTTQDAGGASLTWIDGFFGQHELATQAELNVFPGSSGETGLPNTAHFAGDGVSVPTVQLSWNDGTNGGSNGNATNCILIQNDVADAGPANSLAFNVPSAAYTQVQIYVLATHTASNLAVTLVYADKTTESSTVTVPAWDAPPSTLDAGPGTHVLVSGLTAIDESEGALSAFTVSIFALDLNPIATKSLLAVELLDRGGADPAQDAFETTIFYGAAAW